MAELLRQDRLRVEYIQMRLSDDANENVKKQAANPLSSMFNVPLLQANAWAQQRAHPRYGRNNNSTDFDYIISTILDRQSI